MKCFTCGRPAHVLDPIFPGGGFTGACYEHTDLNDDFDLVPLNADIEDVSEMD